MKLLIVRLGSLGDVVHAIPFAAALRARFPEARIDWMVDPRYLDLLGLVDGLDRRIAVDPRDLFAGRRRGALLRTLGDLRRGGYDVAFDLQGLLKSALLARAVRARRVVGFARADLREPAARFFYSTRVDSAGAAHVIDKNLALLAAVGGGDRRVRFPLNVPASPAVSAVVERSAGGYALVNPGAAWPNKRWPAYRFGAVAEAIRATHGLRPLVLWGPGERALAEEVATASHHAAEVLPETSMIELAALARAARLMISGDTGPLHVAGAVGAPLVALFGPTRPARNGPWAADDITLSRVERCDCVYERRCRRATPCIDDITVAEVLAAVDRRLTAVREAQGR